MEEAQNTPAEPQQPAADPQPEPAAAAPLALPPPPASGPGEVPKGGQPLCRAHAKGSGEPCKNRAVRGTTVCKSHGGGTHKRVLNGTRKMPGAPITSGLRADPNRRRLDSLGHLIDQWRNDPNLRNVDHRLAVLQAALDLQLERIGDGTFDVLKAKDLPADELSWLLEYGGKLVDRIQRANTATFRDALKGSVIITGLALRAIGEVLDDRLAGHPELLAGITDDIKLRMNRLLVPVAR
jgi:hypothetical protein